MQAGYERCLFFSSIASFIKEICSVFIVRESLPVPLLMFWLGTRIFQNLHKIPKKNSVCPEEDKYSDSNIFGQYTYHGSNNGRNSHVQRHYNLPPATFRFCFKPAEVHFESRLGNRVPWGTITSLKMCLSLPQEKVLKIQNQCQDVNAKG